ncbi:MAG: Maf family nucleotide pyrophosphatase [Saprospiraceae bacterium]
MSGKNFNRPLILASKSPRRSQLLRDAGFDFTVQSFDMDESFPPEMPSEEVAPWLAQRKAQAAKHLIQQDEIILTADSVVILDGKIYNKPADYAEAFGMIRALSGRQHTVVTGVCLLSKEKEKVLAGITQVWFAELSDEEIDFYVRTCEPYDKAGAYGAQDWIGHCKITRIEGTFQNVMGLPVDLVYAALRVF